MTPDSHYTYAFADEDITSVKEILSSIPGRWGRMPPLCRAVIVEAGRILHRHNLLVTGNNQATSGRTIGLIGGTRWGSLATDMAFAATMQEDVSLASPAIFGYTLANIPLAEAASHFGLIGPVYALIDQHRPLQRAVEEAKRLLQTQIELDLLDLKLDLMLACEFDAYYQREDREKLSVTFTLVNKND